MHSYSTFLNSSLRPKTRGNITSAPNIPHMPKKQLQVQAHLAGRLKMVDYTYCAAMKGFFLKAKNSKKQFILADKNVKSSRSSETAVPYDQQESENYQVFLSFRGETRTGFTDHLYKGLTQAGYRTFIDYLMRRGENIKEELTKSIRNSQVAVIVISPGYASSHSCLDELVEILLCRKYFGLKVLPVFYLVDPDDVYNLKGNFGATFDGLVKLFQVEYATDKRVNNWKKALKEVAIISGLVLRQYQHETYFIDQIRTEVEKLIGKAPQRVPSFVVGWLYFMHGFNSWLQTATNIKSHIIIGIVAAPKYLFVFTFMALMVIRLGIGVSLDLHSVKQTEKLKKDDGLLRR